MRLTADPTSLLIAPSPETHCGSLSNLPTTVQPWLLGSWPIDGLSLIWSMLAPTGQASLKRGNVGFYSDMFEANGSPGCSHHGQDHDSRR